ncbi:hypothetical protein AB0G04_27115 [Actinoplanes sp. NPDC023801]|uniref:hypothetical protein n=1 Tax=Actinoplanes sp. NPDC023801 TaxID=3154595 RepID=UPI0033DC5971
MDLHTRLQRFGGPIESVPEETVEADVARGRRAAQRRRVVQTVGGSTFAVAAIVATVAFNGAPTGGTGGPSHPPAIVQGTVGNLELVRYEGRQPNNFTIEKVPEGFFIQKDYWGGLTIAPKSVENPAPDVDPSKSPMYDPDDFSGKIAIFLEQKAHRGDISGETVAVGEHRAILHPTGSTWQLLIAVDPKVYATVQVDVALSREQILELGAGLRVHRAAIDRMAAGN